MSASDNTPRETNTDSSLRSVISLPTFPVKSLRFLSLLGSSVGMAVSAMGGANGAVSAHHRSCCSDQVLVGGVRVQRLGERCGSRRREARTRRAEGASQCWNGRETERDTDFGLYPKLGNHSTSDHDDGHVVNSGEAFDHHHVHSLRSRYVSSHSTALLTPA